MWARALAVIACCAYPVLNHAAAAGGEPRWAALGIALFVCALASGWLSIPAALLAGAATLAAALGVAAVAPGLLLFVPPVAINLALCTLFARTLVAGREPLVSRFARLERGGQLPPELARYTLNLTRAWAGFF